MSFKQIFSNLLQHNKKFSKDNVIQSYFEIQGVPTKILFMRYDVLCFREHMFRDNVTLKVYFYIVHSDAHLTVE